MHGPVFPRPRGHAGARGRAWCHAADARRALGAGPGAGGARGAAYARGRRAPARRRDRGGGPPGLVRQAGQQPGSARVSDRHAQLPAHDGAQALRLRRRAPGAAHSDGACGPAGRCAGTAGRAGARACGATRARRAGGRGAVAAERAGAALARGGRRIARHLPRGSARGGDDGPGRDRVAARRAWRPERADHTAPGVSHAQGQLAHGRARGIWRGGLGARAIAQRLAGRAKADARAAAAAVGRGAAGVCALGRRDCRGSRRALERAGVSRQRRRDARRRPAAHAADTACAGVRASGLAGAGAGAGGAGLAPGGFRRYGDRSALGFRRHRTRRARGGRARAARARGAGH